MITLGLFHSYSDPSAALMRDGELLGFVEEERFLRNKHAFGWFPNRSIEFLLKDAGIGWSDVDNIAQAWDVDIHDNGALSAHFEAVNKKYPTSDADRAYQTHRNRFLSRSSQTSTIRMNLRHYFGEQADKPIIFLRHHRCHAVMAARHSGWTDSLVLIVDGSGEIDTTTWWHCRNNKLELLHEISVPHSLGWFYSALTEYLGYDAYDGEYKVMGLAAYGKPNPNIKAKVDKIVWPDGSGGFETDPALLSRGDRSYSRFYPDALAAHFGRAPRANNDELEEWHQSLAYETQVRLEEVVESMAEYWMDKTGVRNITLAGGVGHNVKLNMSLYHKEGVKDVFAHPLCSDAGIPIGACMAAQEDAGITTPCNRLSSVSLGPAYDDAFVEDVLTRSKLKFRKVADPSAEAASLLANGKVIGWFQGRMEGGPRALGNRSILADPRDVKSRDRVNAVIKFREFWRPFCPSMTPAGAARYLKKHTYAPFMVTAFHATEEAKAVIPAVVHVDGTARVQIVEREANSRYFELIEAFEKITGVPCLLNTSFNVKGEPIVCTPADAIRTFSATGLDALVIESCIITKSDALG
jgi:carbamoyltransferase